MDAKKIPFDYEYFKSNPCTKLVNRLDMPVTYVGARLDLSIDYPLVFESKLDFYTATIDGKYSVKPTSGDSEHDVFMLIEHKVSIKYAEITDDGVDSCYDSLDYALQYRKSITRSLSKLTIIDGKLVKTETVHIYS